MTKNTYIIGAGASANALPLSAGFNGSLGLAAAIGAFAKNLKDKYQWSENNRPYADKLLSNINKHIPHAEKEESIDSYAKFLFLDGRFNELEEVKEILSVYFMTEQIVEGKIDNRVRSFLIKLLPDKNLFPYHVKIINWNYDFQFQMAASYYRKESFSHNGSTSRKAPPLIEYYPSIGKNSLTMSSAFDNYSMVHMNGIAGLFYNDLMGYIDGYILNIEKYRDINNLFDDIRNNHQKKSNILSFAWENDSTKHDALELSLPIAQKIVENTENLIIIGYSFPTFNREIDRAIIDTILESGLLKRIYIQNITDNRDLFKSEFEIKDNIDIFHIPNVSSYKII